MKVADALDPGGAAPAHRLLGGQRPDRQQGSVGIRHGHSPPGRIQGNGEQRALGPAHRQPTPVPTRVDVFGGHGPRHRGQGEREPGQNS